MSADVELLTVHRVGDADLRAALQVTASASRRGLRRRSPDLVVVGSLAEDVVVDVQADDALVMRVLPGRVRTTGAGSRWVVPVALELRDERLTELGWQTLWRLARRFDGLLVVAGEEVDQPGLRTAAPGELDTLGGPPDPPADAVVVTTGEVVLDLPGDPADCWHHVVAAVTGWAADVLGAPAWWDPESEWRAWDTGQPPAPRTWPIGVRLASADGRTVWRLAEDRVVVETRAAADLTDQLRARLADLGPWGPREARFSADD